MMQPLSDPSHLPTRHRRHTRAAPPLPPEHSPLVTHHSSLITHHPSLSPQHSALIIGQSTLSEIRAHALAAYPEECCGLLIGRRDGERHHVDRIVRSQNVSPGDRTRRYELDPQLVFAALLAARSGSGHVVGFYHSHPDARPAPSDLDRALAWPDQSYLIIAVSGGPVAALRSWRMPDCHAPFEEEALLVT